MWLRIYSIVYAVIVVVSRALVLAESKLLA